MVAQSSIPCRFFPLPGFKHLSKISLATFTHAAFRFLQNIFSRTISHTPQRRYFRKRTTSQLTQSLSQIVEMADSSVAANGNSLLETTKTSEVRYRYPKSLPFHGTFWTDMLTTPYSILLRFGRRSYAARYGLTWNKTTNFIPRRRRCVPICCQWYGTPPENSHYLAYY